MINVVPSVHGFEFKLQKFWPSCFVFFGGGGGMWGEVSTHRKIGFIGKEAFFMTILREIPSDFPD